MGRTGWIAAVATALVVGFVAGWVVFGGGAGGSDDVARACTAAEELPEQLEFEDDGGPEQVALLNRIAAVGMLAQSTGQIGDGQDDLDELGQAGQDLYRVLQTLDFDEYAEARDALIDAC